MFFSNNFNKFKFFLTANIISLFLCFSNTLNAKAFNWPEGKKAAISLSYDDGYNDNLTNAIPHLSKYNYKATFYLTKNIVLNQRFISKKPLLKEWQKAFLDGHEIGGHGIEHTCKNFKLEDINREVYQSKIWLDESIGVDPQRTYAYPCGEIMATDKNGNQSSTIYPNFVAKHYYIGRTVNAGTVSIKNFRQERSKTNAYLVVPNKGDTLKHVERILDNAEKKGEWAILIFHSIGGNPKTATYAVSNTLHQKILKLIHDRQNLWVAPVRDVSTYLSWHG